MIDASPNFRIRIRHPRRFISGTLRTRDVGRQSKAILGVLKYGRKFAIQSILLSMQDVSVYRVGRRVILSMNSRRMVDWLANIRDRNNMKFGIRVRNN